MSLVWQSHRLWDSHASFADWLGMTCEHPAIYGWEGNLPPSHFVYGMNNYDIMRQAAQARFCTYDCHTLSQRPGVAAKNTCLSTLFLGEEVEIDRKTGVCTFPGEGRQADFGETLTVLDWLCDGDPQAKAANAFCPITALTRAYTSGNGLSMSNHALSAAIEENPEAFRRACESMGGREVAAADVGYELYAFPNLPFRLKFYFSDEDFPGTLQFHWDKNTLSFLRYETVYYLAGCVLRRLKQRMEFPGA